MNAEETLAYIDDPAHVDDLLESIACGGTMIEWCRRCGASYAAVTRYVMAEPERRDRLATAVEIQGLYLSDIAIRNLRAFNDFSILDAYDEDGGLRDLSAMPENLRRAITSVTTKSVLGEGETVSETVTKISTVRVDKALELLGRYRKLFTDRVQVEAGGDLADIVAASFEAGKKGEA